MLLYCELCCSVLFPEIQRCCFLLWIFVYISILDGWSMLIIAISQGFQYCFDQYELHLKHIFSFPSTGGAWAAEFFVFKFTNTNRDAHDAWILHLKTVIQLGYAAIIMLVRDRISQIWPFQLDGNKIIQWQSVSWKRWLKWFKSRGAHGLLMKYGQ